MFNSRIQFLGRCLFETKGQIVKALSQKMPHTDKNKFNFKAVSFSRAFLFVHIRKWMTGYNGGFPVPLNSYFSKCKSFRMKLTPTSNISS